MVYRRTHDLLPASPQWRRDHRALLAECGVPDAVADSDRRWAYVVLHGDDYSGTGWDTTWISRDQAKRLLAILERDLENETGYHLLRLLRERVAG